jgi:hypothetical protein
MAGSPHAAAPGGTVSGVSAGGERVPCGTATASAVIMFAGGRSGGGGAAAGQAVRHRTVKSASRRIIASSFVSCRPCRRRRHAGPRSVPVPAGPLA